jgi:hypothetical protein
MWPCWWCFVGVETQKEFGMASGEVSWRLITTALPGATVGGVIMGTASLATTGCSYRHGFETAPAIQNTKSKSVYRPAKWDEDVANYRFVLKQSGSMCCQMLHGRAVGTPVSFSGVPGFKFRLWNSLSSLRFLQINPARCTILLSIFISLLCMLRATMLPSSGKITVSMGRWYLSLRMGGVSSTGWSITPASRADANHTEWQIPTFHRYSNFSRWWQHGCPRHVEKGNKYTKQNCAPSWIYLQDCTRCKVNKT